MLIKSALRIYLSVSYVMKSILRIGSLRSPPPIRLRRTSPCSGGRINCSMLFCRDMVPWLSIHSPTTKWGEGGGASHQRGGMHFRRPQDSCKGFRRQRRHKKWRQKRRTSPAGTVSQPIGKPFNGQAKGLLWLTWRSYAGPPQYYITPEGESPEPACKAKPIIGRTLAAQGRKARRLAQPSRP